MPIELIEKDTVVYACDLETGSWLPADVLSCNSIVYGGDMITISIVDNQIVSTGNQSYYVLSGDGLFTSPVPRELVNNSKRDIGTGRWVEARDLKAGDILTDINEQNLFFWGNCT